jgi:hypothetical protein
VPFPVHEAAGDEEAIDLLRVRVFDLDIDAGATGAGADDGGTR